MVRRDSFSGRAAVAAAAVAIGAATLVVVVMWRRGRIGKGGANQEEEEVERVLNLNEEEVQQYIHDELRKREYKQCVPIVQRTWAALKPNRLEPTMASMYSLFRERDPDAAAVFSNRLNWEEQQHAFSMMMGTLTSIADSPEAMERMLSPLGKRHYEHGVRVTYFNSMLSALLEALSMSLGNKQFGDKEKTAWAQFFQTISSCMQLAGDGIYVIREKKRR